MAGSSLPNDATHLFRATKRKAEEMGSEDAGQTEYRTVILTQDPDALVEVSADNFVLELKVSEQLMGQASDVFRAMLSSHMVEGVSKQITLGEDDPLVVEVLCTIIHHKAEKSTLEKLDAPGICELIELADLYNCLDLVKPWIAVRLAGVSSRIYYCVPSRNSEREPITWRGEGEDLLFYPETLAHIAGILQLRHMFVLATRAWFFTSEEASYPGSAGNVQMVTFGRTTGGETIHAYINRYRRRLMDDLLTRIFDILKKYDDAESADENNVLSTDGARADRTKLHHVATRLELTKQGITASAIGCCPESLQSVSNKIMKAAHHGARTNAKPNVCLSGDHCRMYCEDRTSEVWSEIFEATSETFITLPGVCLNCLLGGIEDAVCDKYNCKACTGFQRQSYKDPKGMIA